MNMAHTPDHGPERTYRTNEELRTDLIDAGLRLGSLLVARGIGGSLRNSMQYPLYDFHNMEAVDRLFSLTAEAWLVMADRTTRPEMEGHTLHNVTYKHAIFATPAGLAILSELSGGRGRVEETLGTELVTGERLKAFDDAVHWFSRDPDYLASHDAFAFSTDVLTTAVADFVRTLGWQNEVQL